MGIIINHYKDPYQITSIMESTSFFSWLNWKMPYQVIYVPIRKEVLGIGGGCEHMRVIEKQVFIFFVGIISLERDKKRLEQLAVQKLRVM